MNAVVYYSNTGGSREIARYMAEELGYPLFDIEKAPRDSFSRLVVVFCVHCQNIPDMVRRFLQDVKAEELTVIAAYGRMNHGNVLYEIQKEYSHKIVAAAYIPIKHTYIENDKEAELGKLARVIEKVNSPSPVIIPRARKSFFADLFPKTRSRIGVKITKTDDCISCGACNEICRYGAVKNGIINANCIRCLGCVRACSQSALKAHMRLPLRLYLRKSKFDKTEIFV